MLGLGNTILKVDYTGGGLPAPLYSLTFDQSGSNDAMTFSETVFDVDGSNYSFSFWAKLDTSENVTILGGAGWFKQHIGLNPAHTNAFFIESDTNHDRAYSDANQVLQSDVNDWHHYIVTVTSGVVKFYYDGSDVTMSTTSGNNLDGDNMTVDRLGGDATTSLNTQMDGHIYQFGIWDKVLTVNEAASIYNSGTPISLEEDSGSYVSSGDLIHLWNFDEGTGTSCADSAGSLTGTLIGDATFSSDVP